MRRWICGFLPGSVMLACGFGCGTSGSQVEDLAGDLGPDLEETNLPCADGARECQGNRTAICLSGAWALVSDCAADGWTCRLGHCEATGPETPTEAAWRQRLEDLRVANARAPLEIDPRGGWVGAPDSLERPAGNGFFQVRKLGDTWWFLTPEGRPFFSKGVTDVHFLGPNLAMDDLQAALADKYGSEEAWVEATKARLDDWAFNTAGPWSGRSILERITDAQPILDIGHRVPRPPGSPVSDFFVGDYPLLVRQLAWERCAPRRDDPNLLGWFLDNELFWDNGWQTQKRLIRLYFEFPDGWPGRAAALAHLRDAAGDSLEAFQAAWGVSLSSWGDLPAMSPSVLEPKTPEAVAWAEAFALKVFRRYAEEAVQAIREADPHHLVLGCRFSTWHFDALMIEATRFFDVVSLAYYWETPPVDHLDRVGPGLDHPFLLEEWSFKAEDSGLPNILNFAPVVPTQKDRGLAYGDYVEALVRRPWVVAFHWYKWFDNPTREDNLLAGDNFGLMNAQDEPYEGLVRMVREVNRRVEWWHLEGPGPGQSPP